MLSIGGVQFDSLPSELTRRTAKIILENVMLCNFVAIFDLHIITHCMQMDFACFFQLSTRDNFFFFVFVVSVGSLIIIKTNVVVCDVCVSFFFIIFTFAAVSFRIFS